MTIFSNPFLPFFDTELSNTAHKTSFRDPIGHTFAVAEQLGDQTFLRNQIGQNIGSIQHFTNHTDLIKDAAGCTNGTLHHFSNTTMLTDNLGTPQLFAQQVGDHLLVKDSIGHQLSDIYHIGDTLVATDPTGRIDWTAHET